MPASDNIDEFLVPPEKIARSDAMGFLAESYCQRPIIDADNSSFAFSTEDGDPITTGLDVAMSVLERALPARADVFFPAIEERWSKLIIDASGARVHWLASDWMEGVRRAVKLAHERHPHDISDNQVEQFIASRLAALEVEIDADIAKNPPPSPTKD